MSLPRTIKYPLIFITIIVLLIIAIPTFLFFIVDPNQFKPELEIQVKHATSLDLKIEGDLSWKILPTLSLHMGHTELHTVKAYDSDTLLMRLNTIETGVDWRALFSGRLAIEKLNVDGLQLRMVTDTSGRMNWEDIQSQKNNTTAKSSPTSSSESTQKTQTPNLSVLLSSLKLSDINLQIIDLSTQAKQNLLVNSIVASNVNIEGKPFPLKAQLKFEQQGQHAKTTSLVFNTQASINTRTQSYTLNQLEGRLDNSQFTGNTTIELDRNLFFEADIKIDHLNIDDYLNKEATKEAADTSNTNITPGKNSTSTEELPLDVLKTISTKLQLSINELITNNTTLKNVSLNAHINKGILKIEQLHADVFDGSIDFSMTLNSNPNPSTLKVEQLFSAIDIARALKSQEVDVDFSGKANVRSQLASTGNTVNAWKKYLNGTTSLQITEGYYGDDNIEHRVCQAIALTRGEKLTADWSQGTNLRTVETTITWSRGVGKINPLSAGLDNVNVSGTGRLSLIDSAFDMRLDANVSGDVASKDPGCEINQRYRDIAWPLRCKGNSENSECGIDNSRLDKIIANTLKTKAKEKAEKKIQKELEKALGDKLGDGLNEKLGKELGGALDKLFK